MKKHILIFTLLFSFSFSKAQLIAEFTWCPQPDPSGTLCCIQFQSLSTDSGGVIASYFYLFGDGQESTQPDPLHCYAAIATYEVYLIVTDTSGQADTVMYPLSITHLDTVGCNCDSLIGVSEHELSSNSFSVSPNPFKEKSFLSWKLRENSSIEFGQAEIRIYNSTGTFVRSEFLQLKDKKYKLERKDLPPGIYNYEILSPDKIRIGSGKFVIE